MIQVKGQAVRFGACSTAKNIANAPWARLNYGMNWHEVIDQRSYELHQVIADELQKDPEKLIRVVDWIQQKLADPDYSIHSKDAISEWLDLIISEGLKGVLRVLSEQSENATRMRQSSPFAVVMPQDKRAEIFRRYEARRTRTYSAGV